MTETRWWRYIQRLTDGDTAQEAARRAGFDKSAFTRWKKGARADPDFVVKIARAYGANVLEALVEAEFITEEEAALHEVQPTPREVLADVRDSLIAQELLTRVLTYEIYGFKSARGDTNDTAESFAAKVEAARRAVITGESIASDESEDWPSILPDEPGPVTRPMNNPKHRRDLA